jgi:phosphate starvation-inducible PhoH-like protein
MTTRVNSFDRENPAARHIKFDDTGVCQVVFGPANAHLRQVEELSGLSLSARGTELTLQGEKSQVEIVFALFEELYELARLGRLLCGSDFERAYSLKAQDSTLLLRDVFMDKVFISHRKRLITPQGLGQKRYVEAIRHHDVVFGVGPAGTGKTYLAMAMAVAALKDQSIRRIVITRPAVEAGEKLGFLPGDMAEKVSPYLRPLYDALYDMLDEHQVARMMDRRTIEVAPLAFMRGRTLNDSFVILDEAQNTTSEQMKMFLTRLGYESKAVITGDITQVDLPAERVSGLVEAQAVLAGIEGISFCMFSEADVVRHPLVRDVIRAYERLNHHQKRDKESGF